MNLNFKDDKVVGYILLAVGVTMMFLSVYLMYNVLTGASVPPTVINLSSISFSGPEGTIMDVISGEDLSRLVSMGAWCVLMFFILYAGGKIASLGISLIKEIKAEIKIREPKKPSTTEVAKAK